MKAPSKKTVQKKYVSKKLLKILSPNISTFKPKLKLIFLLLFFLFTSISLVNPKIGTQLNTVKREGVDIVFAIDVSKPIFVAAPAELVSVVVELTVHTGLLSLDSK